MQGLYESYIPPSGKDWLSCSGFYLSWLQPATTLSNSGNENISWNGHLCSGVDNYHLKLINQNGNVVLESAFSSAFKSNPIDIANNLTSGIHNVIISDEVGVLIQNIRIVIIR